MIQTMLQNKKDESTDQNDPDNIQNKKDESTDQNDQDDVAEKEG